MSPGDSHLYWWARRRPATCSLSNLFSPFTFPPAPCGNPLLCKQQFGGKVWSIRLSSCQVRWDAVAEVCWSIVLCCRLPSLFFFSSAAAASTQTAPAHTKWAGYQNRKPQRCNKPVISGLVILEEKAINIFKKERPSALSVTQTVRCLLMFQCDSRLSLEIHMNLILM